MFRKELNLNELEKLVCSYYQHLAIQSWNYKVKNKKLKKGYLSKISSVSNLESLIKELEERSDIHSEKLLCVVNGIVLRSGFYREEVSLQNLWLEKIRFKGEKITYRKLFNKLSDSELSDSDRVSIYSIFTRFASEKHAPLYQQYIAKIKRTCHEQGYSDYFEAENISDESINFVEKLFNIFTALYHELPNKGRLIFYPYSTVREMIDIIGKDMGFSQSFVVDFDESYAKDRRTYLIKVDPPFDVRLTLHAGSSYYSYKSTLHELGHAYHFTNLDPDAPLFERLTVPNSVSEVFAFLFEDLNLDKRWLDQYTYNNSHETDSYLIWNKRELIGRYMYACLMFLVDVAVFKGENGQEKYAELYEKATGSSPSESQTAAWAIDATGSTPFQTASYLYSHLASAALTGYMRQEFGDYWFKSRDAGNFLKSLWHDPSLNIESLLDIIGYENDPSQLYQCFIDTFDLKVE